MKKLGIITAALLMGLTTAFAQTESKPVKKDREVQPHNHPHPHAQKQERHAIAENIDLSDVQKLEIEKINKNSSEKSKVVRMSYKGKEDKSGMKDEIRKIQDQRKLDIKNVLTEEQKKKLKAEKQERKKL